jgi:hypothetical protein
MSIRSDFLSTLMPRRWVLPILMLMTCHSQVSAATYHSASSGTWNSSGTWQNGNVPPVLNTDTVLIHHHVTFNTTLNFYNPAFVRIDSNASLCGHERFIMHTGASFIIYGEFYADSLYIPGGNVTSYGSLYLKLNAWISNGGSLSSTGYTEVGADFNCSGKLHGLADGLSASFVQLYPNPVSRGGDFVISNWQNGLTVKIYDSSGDQIEIPNDGARFAAGTLSPGIYFVVLENGTGRTTLRLLVL